MKLLRHGPTGAEHPGMLHTDGTIRDLTGLVPAIGGAVLSDTGIAMLRGLDASTLPVVPATTRLGPCVAGTGKFICIGLNYGEHVRETGREITEVPTIFLRLPESQVAHGQDILRPAESHRLDYEAEIAIVIGKGGRRIQEANAWDHIAGYSCYNDGSVRDWQVATSQWTPGKNFYKTGGFGPWLVTADEIAPNRVMRLQTILNGQVLQDTTTDKMIHSIPRQIAYISTFTPLSAGDVIVTGTPGGVGNKRNPQVFMKPGDTCEIVVDAIGTLRNGIRDDA